VEAFGGKYIAGGILYGECGTASAARTEVSKSPIAERNKMAAVSRPASPLPISRSDQAEIAKL